MAQLISSNNSITFTYGGIDSDGDTVIYMDSNAVTEPTPILCEVNGGADILQDVRWDETLNMWVIEHGVLRGQLT